MKKRLVAIILTVVTVMALVIAPAMAAWHYFGYGKPIKCYSKKAETTIVYEAASEKAKRKGKIWAWDEISIFMSTIDKTGKGWFYVEYPKDGGGTLDGWIRMSDVLGNGIYAESEWDYYECKAPHKITTYKRSNGDAYGSISKKDKVRVYKFSATGSRILVRYPLDTGGYKYGWINKTDAKKYLKF